MEKLLWKSRVIIHNEKVVHRSVRTETKEFERKANGRSPKKNGNGGWVVIWIVSTKLIRRFFQTLEENVQRGSRNCIFAKNESSEQHCIGEKEIEEKTSTKFDSLA